MPTYIRDKVLRRNKLFDDPTSIYRRLGIYLYQGYVPSSIFQQDDVVPEFKHIDTYHDQNVYDKNGKLIGRRKIDSLNVPKILTSYLRKAIMGEGSDFSIDNDDTDEKYNFFKEILDRNNFHTSESDAIELMLNGGDKLLLFGYRRQQVKLSYLNGFKFEVVEYEQGQAKSVVVYTDKVRQEEGKMYFYTMLEYHKLCDDMDDVEPYYEIRREIYKSSEKYKLDRGVRFNEHVGMFGNYKEHEEFIGVDVPMFVFTRLPYRNNKQLDTIRGLGLMINSLDVNRSIDLAFDANNKEIHMTRFQILVPDEMLEHGFDREGNMIDYYNSDKSWYSGLNASDGFQFQPVVVSPPIRQESYTAKIKQDLDLLCLQLSLSPGTLSFDKHSGRVTATQVMAEMNETYRTKTEIGNAITKGWKELIWSIYKYSKNVWNIIDWDMEFEDINFDLKDSVIIDDEAEFARDLQAVQNNIMPVKEFIIRNYKLSDTDADAWIEQLGLPDFGFIEEDDEDLIET